MRIKLLAAALFLGAAIMYVGARGPLNDKVIVTLPYQVTIKDAVLAPGEYTIRQMDSSGGNNRVLYIFSDSGMKHEATAMTIPTLDNKTPEDTKVILHHIDGGYYFDKIWIQGKNYGYEFVLPEEVRSRQREATTVAARYEPAVQEPAQPVPSDAAAKQAEADRQAEQDRLAAERRREDERRMQAERELAERERLAAAERDRLERERIDAEARARDQQAQAEPVPAPAEPTTPEEPATPDMPDTSLNWLPTLLGGALLTGLGIAARRRA